MKVFVFILFTFVGFLSLAQKVSYEDSLKKLLKKRLDDSVRVTVLLDLAECLPEEKEWLPYNREALSLARKAIKTSSGKRRDYFYQAKGHAIANLGFYYDYHGQREQSIDYYFKALFLYDKAGSQEDKASVYSNLGVLYTNQGDYKEAEDLLIKALNLKKKFDPLSVSKNYNNLGVLYEKQDQFRKALFYYKKSLMAARKQQDHEDISIGLTNLGTYYYNRNEFKKAVPLFTEAINECMVIQDEVGAAWIQANLGNCYVQMGDEQAAETLMLKAESVADKYDNADLQISVVEKLYNLYLKKKDYEQALQYHQKLEQLNRKINNLTDQKDALRHKLQYDHGVEKARISMKAEQEEMRLNQQIWFILAILIISVLLGTLTYRRFRISQKQKAIIEEQKREVEHKNKEITDSINYAKYLQQSMLPSKEELFSGIGSAFLFYRPKDIVSGDFYWRHETTSFIYLAVADCTGHGVPGAMVSVVCSNALDKVMEVLEEPVPGELLDKVRELVVRQFSTSYGTINDGMDISIVRIEKEGSAVWFAGANHTCLQIAEDTCLEYKGNRQPIGKLEQPLPYTTFSLEQLPNSWIYMFSDGIVDQFGGEKGKKLKLSVLKNFLSSLSNDTAEKRAEKLAQFFNDYRGEMEQTDDVCLIGFVLK